MCSLIFIPFPCDNRLVSQCAVPSPVVDAVVDARAESFWNSVEFDCVDPKSWKRSVLPVSHATKLTCTTANVLTMQETESMPSASERGCNVSGRRAALQLEFTLPRASIVGLQETRSKNTSARKCDTFFMVASAGTKAGTDGCELWAATSLKPSSSTVRADHLQTFVAGGNSQAAFCSDYRYGGPCSSRAAASECQRKLVE